MDVPISGIERTFVMLKPDTVQRRLIGEILCRIERKGFRIIALKMVNVDEELAKLQYNIHSAKPFFERLVKFTTSGPVIAMVIAGEDAVSVMRTLIGNTDPKQALPGTIRGDFGYYITKNLVHASDSKDMAKREIDLYFDESELVDYRVCNEDWVFGTA